MEVPSPIIPKTEKRGDSPAAALATKGKNKALADATFASASRRPSALRDVLAREIEIYALD